MRVSQESDQHYHKERYIDGQNGGGGADQAMRLQGGACPNDRVVSRFDLSST